MAIVNDSQCSFIANLVINTISSVKYDSETEGKMKIQNYLQELKKEYNKNILSKCLGIVVNEVDNMYYNDGISPWSDM